VCATEGSVYCLLCLNAELFVDPPFDLSTYRPSWASFTQSWTS
jgi:hypothetical protein